MAESVVATSVAPAAWEATKVATTIQSNQLNKPLSGSLLHFFMSFSLTVIMIMLNAVPEDLAIMLA